MRDPQGQAGGWGRQRDPWRGRRSDTRGPLGVGRGWGQKGTLRARLGWREERHKGTLGVGGRHEETPGP